MRERVWAEGAERMLRSEGFARLREENNGQWSSINATVNLSKALGGYMPVRYYMHEAQEGFGRLKSEVMVKGMRPMPYVRMRKEARASMASEYYWDVDMENCQASLLEQKLRQYKIACPMLTRYVEAREASVKEVMEASGVRREEAKRLFIRLMFFGGVKGWQAENPGAEGMTLPEWVWRLKDELRESATTLLKHPMLADLKESHTRRGVSMTTTTEDRQSSDPMSSLMATYLQSLESECVRALVRAVQGDCRAVGGIIHDGILVEKEGDETRGPSEAELRAWEDAVRAATGMSVKLVVKKLEAPEDWRTPARTDEQEEESWMDGRHMMSYEEVKTRWEANTFKVVKSGNYVREDPQDGSRSVMSDKQLMESYKHLHFADMKVSDAGDVRVSASYPFVARWMKDPTIRTYKEMIFAPPPMVVSSGSYNIWDGFDAERSGRDQEEWKEPEGGWGAHQSVRAFVEFHERLMGVANAKYVLDWSAQMYQNPAKKTGIALLLKGEEGVGKNRLTDLHRATMGRDKFLQTATPVTTLYGRFNRQREGRMLIVINESNGGDNFAAVDVIKDMITCDEFQSEGKGTNSYTMSCYARFMFTTNNENCLKVNPDSRRYAVIEVSSAMKGDTEYFRELSRMIDEPSSRHAFYMYLQSRDVSQVDWINDRPVTEYLLQMVGMNMPYEHQFVKHLVLTTYHEARLKERLDSPVTKQTSDLMYEDFVGWLAANHVRYDTTRTKFGIRMTKLVRNEERHTGFHGMKKTRCGMGVVYRLDVRRLVAEMREQRWVSPDEV